MNAETKTSIIRMTLTAYLVSLSTVVMPFYAGLGINVLYLAASVVCVATIFLLDPARAYVRKDVAALVLLLVLTLSFAMHFTPARISTIFYSWFFILSFVFITGNYRHYFTAALFSSAIRLIVQLFFVVMVIQQIGGVTGLPIINLNPLFSSSFISSLYLFRYNSLSSEPSYGAAIIVFLAYIYSRYNGFNKKELVRFWLPALYLWVFFDSGLALVLGVLIAVIAGRKYWYWLVIPGLLIFMVGGLSSVERLVNIFQNLEVGVIDESLITADLSAAYRVVPVFLYFDAVDISSAAFWFGHGPDYASTFIELPAMEEKGFMGGLIPSLLLDYGFIAFVAFIIFSHRAAAGMNLLVFYLIFIVLMTNASLNTQLMWCFLSFFAIAKMIPVPSPEPKGHGVTSRTQPGSLAGA